MCVCVCVCVCVRACVCVGAAACAVEREVCLLGDEGLVRLSAQVLALAHAPDQQLAEGQLAFGRAPSRRHLALDHYGFASRTA